MSYSHRSSVVKTRTSVREIPGSIPHYIFFFSLEGIWRSTIQMRSRFAGVKKKSLLYTKLNEHASGQKTKHLQQNILNLEVNEIYKATD